MLGRSPVRRAVIVWSLLIIAGPSVRAGLPPGTFLGLGLFPGDYQISQPLGISSDGSSTVGYSAYTNDWQAFRWTESGGMSLLDPTLPAGYYSVATGASSDGSVVVGGYGDQNTDWSFRWTAETGITRLHELEPGMFNSVAWDVSDDGHSTAGAVNAGGLDFGQPFYWTSSYGLRLLDLSGTGYSDGVPVRISGDGRTMVGRMTRSDSAGYQHEAFYWRDETGFVKLGGLHPFVVDSLASGVSYDGSTIVGQTLAAPNDRLAFKWTEAAGMQSLGDLPGGQSNSHATAVSADGSIIVGAGSSDIGQEAFVWDESRGMRSIMEILTDQFGADLSGWQLAYAYDVSADGRTIVGWGINPQGQTEAWIAVIPEPGTLLLVLPLVIATCVYRRGVLGRASQEVVAQYQKSVSPHVVLMTSIVFCAMCSARAGLPPGTFLGLGQSSGSTARSQGLAVSGDGRTAAGLSEEPENIMPFRWTESDGMSLLLDPGSGASGIATGVSYDGSVIVGGMSGNFPDVGFRWTADDGAVPLHPFSLDFWSSFAWDVSADGGTVVGVANTLDIFTEGVPFIWTQDDGMRLLSVAGTGYPFGSARRVSGDGRIVVGNLTRSNRNDHEAFYWSDGLGLVKLGGLYSGVVNSFALGTSYDGSTIVGESLSLNGYQAFRWTEAQGMQSLWEALGRPRTSTAFSTSADGSVIVGTFVIANERRLFVLDDQLGMRELETILVNDFGADLTGWNLAEPVEVSADGNTIVGWGINPEGRTEAWIAVIPEPGSVGLIGVVALALVRRRRGRLSPC